MPPRVIRRGKRRERREAQEWVEGERPASDASWLVDDAASKTVFCLNPADACLSPCCAGAVVIAGIAVAAGMALAAAGRYYVPPWWGGPPCPPS